MKKKTRTKTTSSASRAKPASGAMMASNDTKKGACCGMWCSCCWSGISLLLLRLALAGLFLSKGIMKLMDPAATSAMFTSWGFWGWLGPVVGAVEVVAGALLLLGFWSRWAGKATALVVLVALLTVHRGQLFSANFPWMQVLAFTGSLVIAGNGPGTWALDRSCGCADSCGCC